MRAVLVALAIFAAACQASAFAFGPPPPVGVVRSARVGVCMQARNPEQPENPENESIAEILARADGLNAETPERFVPPEVTSDKTIADIMSRARDMAESAKAFTKALELPPAKPAWTATLFREPPPLDASLDALERAAAMLKAAGNPFVDPATPPPPAPPQEQQPLPPAAIAPPIQPAPQPVPPAPTPPRESAADILARAAAMGSGSRVPTKSPLAPPSHTPTAPSESVADILARAAAMGSGTVPPTHAGGNRHNAPEAAAPSPSAPPAPSASSAGGSVAEILARAAAMERDPSTATHAGGNRHTRPQAAPPSTAVGRESAADILTRAAAMGGASAPRAASLSSPPPAPPAAPPAQKESVADILARAAAMANGSVAPTHTGGNRHSSATQASAPSYHSGQAAQGASAGESVADILARAAAMGSGPAPSAGGAARGASAPSAGESVADILARAAQMGR